MIKISIKPDLSIDRKIYFTTNEYKYLGELIVFTDKFGTKQTWNIKHLINIEEGEQE